MPELPEVETVRQTLKKIVLGKKIKNVIINYQRIIQNSDSDTFIKSLIGRTIIDINRLGKYMYFCFENKTYLISHLRMEGKYFIKDSSLEIDKHEHIIFQFEDGSDLRYHDVRKFGTMELKNEDNLLTTHPLSDLGVEANRLDGKYLFMKMNNKNQPLKTFLLDQSNVAGIGNIYADEICFKARLHPLLNVKKITLEECEKIAEASNEIINKAILAGGSTIRSYTSSLNVTGLFQLQLLVHTKKGEACCMCNNTIIKCVVGGRGTYLCPNCQKLEK